MQFDNTYARLPEAFYERISPVPARQPSLIRLNTSLADELGLTLPESPEALAALFSGASLLPGMDPIAMAYAGHQFGGFVPQLGDGRAVVLGEVVSRAGKRYDIQLKGSGRTRFSRGGDGRSALGPVIREYVVSEAMHALGIPTTRALAMVATGEDVFREMPTPGGIFTRVASGLVRVGTFEFFAARKMHTEVRTLADYVIDRHYPEAKQAPNPYAQLFRLVCEATARLVANWMAVGFIHGVMNTDNTSVAGETIDYGPCAFMDTYVPNKVFSSIDRNGRYAYDRQPAIAQWNMGSLGGCLLGLLDADEDRARAVGEEILADFSAVFSQAHQEAMCRKLGLEPSEKGAALAGSLLRLMADDFVDFTLAFRSLTDDEQVFRALFSRTAPIDAWLAQWRAMLESEGTSRAEAERVMRGANPVFIPRNHRIEQAIRAAEDEGDFVPTHRLIDVLQRPYELQPEYEEYTAPPKPGEVVHQTFCGT